MFFCCLECVCSRDLDVLRAQMIMGFFILPTNHRGQKIRSRGYNYKVLTFLPFSLTSSNTLRPTKTRLNLDQSRCSVRESTHLPLCVESS